MCGLAALGLVVGACGGGDDASTPDDAADVSTDVSVEPSGEVTEEPTAGDEPTADDPTDGESTADEMTGDTADEMTGDDEADDTGGGTEIRSMNDVPQECRDEMARFLREVEPIVSSIDWENASFSDFEGISDDFEAISDDFEASSASAGCDDLDFVGENETELLIEFARDEAPGTVPFLEFISVLSEAATPGGDGGSASGDALESCDDAIAWIEGLLAEYDSFADVPAAELLQFTQLSSLFGTCSPEQLAFFDSPEVAAFLEG